LKQHLPKIREFNIDGVLLMKLDKFDFEEIGIIESDHQEKIKVSKVETSNKNGQWSYNLSFLNHR